MTSKHFPQPVIAIAGHAGAGHVHSHSGFVQDDSVGFAVTCNLMKKFYPVDTTIESVQIEGDTISVQTKDGGKGSALARRGFTPWEKELVQKAVGHDGLYSQGVACICFGRMYGQGAMEGAVALQSAICLAVIDTFLTVHGNHFLTSSEGIDGNIGRCLGTVVSYNDIYIALLATLNATAGGIGPVEDNEGNINLSEKGALMEALGINLIPTIIVESKAWIPALGSSLKCDTFLARFNREIDNPVVGEALYHAIQQLRLPAILADTHYPRDARDMNNLSIALAEKVLRIGEELKKDTTSKGKCQLMAELVKLAAEDGGGISYMSSDVYQVVGGGGLMPGSAAVLSLAVCEKTIQHEVIPFLHKEELAKYSDICLQAVEEIIKQIAAAQQYLHRAKLYHF